MSRIIAKILKGAAQVTTLPMSARYRDRTFARLSQEIGMAGVRKIKTAKGTMEFHALRSVHTSSYVRRFHLEEPETVAWIDNYIKPGETLWDIGANIGLYALYAALIPDVKVFAFEPSGLNFGMLVENINLNGMGDRVSPLCVALNDETKISYLHIREFEPGHACNSVSKAETQFEEFAPVFSQAIPAFTADDFCKLYKLSPPDHIKLDVDGAEGQILAGAAKTLKGVKSALVEVQGKNAEDVTERIERPLLKAGLKEKAGYREEGSQRNRLYLRD